MAPVIKVQGLGKRYTLGASADANQTFREMLVQSFTAPIRRLRELSGGRSEDETSRNEEFWALRDIDFDVQQGEVVGIIGRNGAGKSTLLKILSRITEPTEGRVEIYGRIASLLEVGTGFHPELTGHENIYLNGAILGMSSNEISRKFDEIVAFAEIEKFIDTPVKHYSSGMYVRLAFAVAAHLEPEILVVDEVLAVGDAAFQKKCLGKMSDVSRQGRTVLFVSHNMGAVRGLCTRAIMLQNGMVFCDEDVESVLQHYLSSGAENHESRRVWTEEDAPVCDEVSLQEIRVTDEEGRVMPSYDAKKPVRIEILFRVHQAVSGMRVAVRLYNAFRELAFVSTNHDVIGDQVLTPGEYLTRCTIYPNLLNDDVYIVNVQFDVPGVKFLLPSDDYVSFQAVGSIGHGSYFPQQWDGVLAPRLNWDLEQVEDC